MWFHCTAGRGTEKFVHEELITLFKENLGQVTLTDGKVYFEVNDVADGSVFGLITTLKSVERVFVHAFKCCLDRNLDTRGLLTFLHSSLNDSTMWQKCFTAWTLTHPSYRSDKQNKAKSEKKLSTVHHPDSDMGHEAKLPGVTHSRDGTDKCANMIAEIKPFKRPGHEYLNDEVVFKKSKLESENTSKLEEAVAVVPNMDQPDTSGQKHSVTVASGTSREWKSTRALTAGVPTFRISCKFAGSVKRKLNVQRTASQLGVLVSKCTKWKTDVRNPQMEISIHMNDEMAVVGIPLTRDPLSKRNYIRHYGLRSSVAWIMAYLSQIQAGEAVLDPMCGKGIPLLEAASMNKHACYIGIDRDPSQLKKAKENMVFAGLAGCVQVIRGDATNVPLAAGSMDKVVTDAPFGQNHATVTHIHTFYIDMLVEMYRILKPGGKMVLLTSCHMKGHIHQWLSKSNTSEQSQIYSIPDSKKCDISVIPQCDTNTPNTSQCGKLENSASNTNIPQTCSIPNTKLCDKSDKSLCTTDKFDIAKNGMDNTSISTKSGIQHIAREDCKHRNKGTNSLQSTNSDLQSPTSEYCKCDNRCVDSLQSTNSDIVTEDCKCGRKNRICNEKQNRQDESDSVKQCCLTECNDISIKSVGTSTQINKEEGGIQQKNQYSESRNCPIGKNRETNLGAAFKYCEEDDNCSRLKNLWAFKDCHNMQLGNTEACICELVTIKN